MQVFPSCRCRGWALDNAALPPWQTIVGMPYGSPARNSARLLRLLQIPRREFGAILAMPGLDHSSKVLWPKSQARHLAVTFSSQYWLHQTRTEVSKQAHSTHLSIPLLFVGICLKFKNIDVDEIADGKKSFIANDYVGICHYATALRKIARLNSIPSANAKVRTISISCGSPLLPSNTYVDSREKKKRLSFSGGGILPLPRPQEARVGFLNAVWETSHHRLRVAECARLFVKAGGHLQSVRWR